MMLDIDREIVDDELGLLQESLFYLDSKISYLDALVKDVGDPDGVGLCDRREYFIGLGFAACQKYLAATYGPAKNPKTRSFEIWPCFW